MPSNRKAYFILESSDYKPDQLIKLGQLIADPHYPYRSIAPPLVPLPTIYDSTKGNYSFESSHSETKSASIFTEALSILSLLSGDVSGSLTKEVQGSWKTPALYTQFIEPDDEYVDKSVKPADIQKVLRGLMGKPVYMITGIKIARDADLKAKETKEVEGGTKLVAHGSSGVGVPLKGGTRVTYSKKDKKNEEYNVKDPFVLAYRMREIHLRWGNVRSAEVKGGQLAGQKDHRSSDEDEDHGTQLEGASLEEATIEQEDFGTRAMPPGFRRRKAKDDTDDADCHLMFHQPKVGS